MRRRSNGSAWSHPPEELPPLRVAPARPAGSRQWPSKKDTEGSDSGGYTPELVWRVCFFPLPYPCGIRIGASGDLPMRRKGPFHGRGPLPLLAACSRWRAMGSFRLLGRLGWMIRPVSWWCAPLSSARCMRRRRISLWGMPGGKSAERSGASGASEPAGAKPPRGGGCPQ